MENPLDGWKKILATVSGFSLASLPPIITAASKIPPQWVWPTTIVVVMLTLSFAAITCCYLFAQAGIDKEKAKAKEAP